MKCDEARPACLRCISAGRVCRGYGIWGGGSRPLQPRAIEARKLAPAESATYTIRSQQASAVPAASSSTLNGGRDTLALSSNAIPETPVPALPIAKSLSLLPWMKESEQACFDFFLQHSCIKLPGLNIPRFWRSTLLQASTTEPPVMHAVLALGSLHQRDAGHALRGYEGDQVEVFMLRQYSLALRGLRRVAVPRTGDRSPKMGQGTVDWIQLSPTLITAVIFVYFEFIREQYRNGCAHLHFVLQLLNELGDKFTISPNGPHAPQKKDGLADDWILEPILRLYIQVNQLGQLKVALPVALQHAALDPLPSIFTSLQHARWYLDLLVASILHLQFLQRHSLGQSGSDASESPPTTTPEATRITHTAIIIESQLSVWHTSFSATMTAIARRATQRDHFRYASSLIFQRMAVIMVDVVLARASLKTTTPSMATSPSLSSLNTTNHSTPSFSNAASSKCSKAISSSRIPLIYAEEVYDKHTHLFLQNLQSGIHQYSVSHNPITRAQVIGSVLSELSKNEPTIDQGWLYHLFFTAIKCRVHRIRQHALRLMRTTSHKEGIWDAAITVRIAKEVVRLEEGDFFHPEGEECVCDFGLTDAPPSTVSSPTGVQKGPDLITLPASRRLNDLKISLPSIPDAGSGEMEDGAAAGTPLAIEFTRRSVTGHVVWTRREFVRRQHLEHDGAGSGRWQGRWRTTSSWEA